MNIRTGDKVQFHSIPAFASQPDTIATGLVTKLHNFGGVEYALILCDDKGTLPKLLDTRELTVLTDMALVQAVQALGQDDYDREQAIHACKIADVVSDYAEAKAIGDLSGRELG